MYQISVYIRETGRKKDTGVHTCSKDWRPEEWSGGACRDEGHRVDWEGAKILESEPHYLKRRILEATGVSG